MSTTDAPAPAAVSAPTKPKKAKRTFMLHNPSDMTSLGKYIAQDFRYAALKAVSRGHKQVLLRATNSREIREFAGDVVMLDTPKEIHRGDRVIRYTRKPVVKFVKKWVYSGPVIDEPSSSVDAAAAAGAGASST